jgi:hypothetical protein
MHLTSEEERRALKTGFRVLVQHCGGLEAAAAATRVAKTALAAGYDQEAADRFAALDVVADLERAAGEPVITRLLAAMHGMALVHVEPISGCALRAIADVGKHASEVFAPSRARLRMAPSRKANAKRSAARNAGFGGRGIGSGGDIGEGEAMIKAWCWRAVSRAAFKLVDGLIALGEYTERRARWAQQSARRKP